MRMPIAAQCAQCAGQFGRTISLNKFNKIILDINKSNKRRKRAEDKVAQMKRQSGGQQFLLGHVLH